MTELSIRSAGPGDISAITRIYADAVTRGTASFELTPPDEAEMTRRYETLVSTGYPYLVAEFSGALAAYAYAGPYRARPAYSGPWKTRSMSRRISTAAASGLFCSSG